MFTSITGSDPSIVNTTCPEPLTVPVVNADASFVTVNRSPEVFPPMVNVIVVVGEDDVWVHLNSVFAVQIVKTEIVVRAPASLLSTWRLATVTPPSTIVPEVAVSCLKTMDWPVLVRVPVTVSTRAHRLVVHAT